MPAAVSRPRRVRREEVIGKPFGTGSRTDRAGTAVRRAPAHRDQLRRLHCWFACPLQAHSWILVPFPVAWPLASTHNPDCTPVIAPFVFTFHCWLAWPLQSQMITWVPLFRPCPDASRHLFPESTSLLSDVYVQRWLDWPLQSYNCTWAPFVSDPFGRPPHRPDGGPTI